MNNEIKNDLIYDQMKEENILRLTQKQLNYIIALSRDTKLYENLPKQNDKFTDKNIDNRDLILEDTLKNISSPEASEIIGDLLNEDEESLAKLLK